MMSQFHVFKPAQHAVKTGKLLNKTALITGGNRGIGKAIALRYAQEGISKIVFSYRIHKQEADDLVAELKALGVEALAIQADIANTNDRKKLFDHAVQFLGHIDILINNAGIYGPTKYLDMTEAEYDTMMDVNVKGPLFLTRAVLRHMVKNKIAGRIINMSSIRDNLVTKDRMMYQVSKAAFKMFSDSTAIDMAANGILVNIIAPGSIKTDIHGDALNDPDKLAAMEKAIPLQYVADAASIGGVAVLLASEDGSYMTGTRILVDGGRSLQPTTVIKAKL